MDQNKIYLKFKDREKGLEFDLNKNTVFFGNNGQGKTRILKTINSIYLLAKEQKPGVLSKIIDSMNLNILKVNDVDHTQLFSINNELKEVKRKEVVKFLESNVNIFIQLSTLIHDFPEDNISINPLSRKKGKILNYLDTVLIPIGNKTIIMKDSFTVEGFDRWISDTFQYIKSFKEHFKNILLLENIEFGFPENFDKSYSTLEEALFVITHLRNNRHSFSLKSKLNIRNTKSNDILSERNKIISNLSEKSSIYISTDNLEITSINKKIKVHIDEINLKLNQFFWESKSQDFFNDITFKELINERNEINKKIKEFNFYIKKYANITINLVNPNGLFFLKNNDEMDFDKLSSGEQRITYLFLEILFNDVDIYLIDEPELSLSLNFQNKIITDLHLLTKNKVLFIATHAPYIYEDFIAIEDNISKEV